MKFKKYNIIYNCSKKIRHLGVILKTHVQDGHMLNRVKHE